MVTWPTESFSFVIPAFAGMTRKEETEDMQRTPANDIERRRAAARRTAWIIAAVALAIFLLFFAQTLASHR